MENQPQDKQAFGSNEAPKQDKSNQGRPEDMNKNQPQDALKTAQKNAGGNLGKPGNASEGNDEGKDDSSNSSVGNASTKKAC